MLFWQQIKTVARKRAHWGCTQFCLGPPKWEESGCRQDFLGVKEYRDVGDDSDALQ